MLPTKCCIIIIKLLLEYFVFFFFCAFKLITQPVCQLFPRIWREQSCARVGAATL